jgi:hypothetical protein
MGIRVPEQYAEIVYKLLLVGDAELMLTTLGVSLSAIDTFDAASVDAINDAFVANIMPLLSPDIAYQGLDVQVGPDSAGPQFTQANIVLGSNVGSSLPPNTAGLIQKRTALGGRRNRGRNYIPGVPVSDVNQAGVWGTGIQAQWQTAANNWLAQTAAISSVDEVVIFHSTPPLAPGLLPTPVTSMVVPGKVATQRRRLRP